MLFIIQKLCAKYHIQAFILTNFSVDYFILDEQLFPEADAPLTTDSEVNSCFTVD